MRGGQLTVCTVVDCQSAFRPVQLSRVLYSFYGQLRVVRVLALPNIKRHNKTLTNI